MEARDFHSNSAVSAVSIYKGDDQPVGVTIKNTNVSENMSSALSALADPTLMDPGALAQPEHHQHEDKNHDMFQLENETSSAEFDQGQTLMRDKKKGQHQVSLWKIDITVI